MGKFKLTAAFLAISAVTLIIAAIVILKVSTSQEERNIASMTTEQSARDARLLAGSIIRTLSEGMDLEANEGLITGPAATGNTEESMREFLSNQTSFG